MKSTLSALSCAALASCGGGGGVAASAPVIPQITSASVTGTVIGFPKGLTLLLDNSGRETIAVTENGTFSFAKRVSEGSAYNVTVIGKPSGWSCAVANGSGMIAHGIDSISNLTVSCSSVSFTFVVFNVGVSVTGLLPGNSVTFSNNGIDTVTAMENGLFVFPTNYFTAALYSGRAGGYEVTVKTGSANQTCTINAGSGTIPIPPKNNFVNLEVSCK